MDLYEQIFYELLEIREMFTANEMFTKCEPILLMKTEKQERHSLFSPITSRYLQMEYWLRKTYFDPVEAYAANETKESRRRALPPRGFTHSFLSFRRRVSSLSFRRPLPTRRIMHPLFLVLISRAFWSRAIASISSATARRPLCSTRRCPP